MMTLHVGSLAIGTFAIGTVAIASYLGAAILQYFCLTRPQKSTAKYALAAAILGWLCHSLSLQITLITAEGLQLGIYNTASVIGWFIGGLVLLSSFRKPQRSLFIPVFPIAALSVLLTLLFIDDAVLIENISLLAAAHILLSLLAYSTLTIAAVQALLLAWQDHHLKHRQASGLIMRMPPLQTMELLLFRQISLGVILLTLGMASGAMFIEDLFAQHLAHKTVLSIIAWSIFSVLLAGRYLLGWRGTMAIRLTIGGYFLLLLAFFGSKLVLEVILQR